MSDSGSSVGVGAGGSSSQQQGYAREPVSSPLDLLTTKPAARTKWGSIGGGGGVSASGNAKPSTVRHHVLVSDVFFWRLFILGYRNSIRGAPEGSTADE